MFPSEQKRLAAAVVLVLLTITFFAAAGHVLAQSPEFRGGWQSGPDAFHPNRIIVRFADTIAPNAAVDSLQQLGYSVQNIVDFQATSAFPEGLRIGIVELPDGVSPDSAISRLSTSRDILYAEKDYMRYKYDVSQDIPLLPNDTHFDKTWGLHNENAQYVDPRMLSGVPVDDADIDAPEAWLRHTGSGEVLVAVIDTGIYIDHLDLSDNIWRNEAEWGGEPGVDDDGNGFIDDFWGWNFFSNTNQVFDPNERDEYGYLNDEHGTHVSGTIGAMADNARGVAGINWNVQIMSLKFLGPEGGSTSDAILALQYVADKGAQVVNCSWGGGGFNQSLKDAIEASGALVVCAAGNNGANTDVSPHYPSSYDSENIISVGAMMQDETPADYPGWWSSCYGPISVDLYAPGGYIFSTVPPDPVPSAPGENYDHFYGTSMATPHVVGSAALLHSLRPELPLYAGAPGWNPGDQSLKDIILATVDVKPAYEGRVLTGGRLNLASALAELGGPTITAIDAEPRFGPPPLEVRFTASAQTTSGEIVDVWWDFGDGSEFVHDYEAVHIYEEQGDFTAKFHVLDDEGGEALAALTIKVFFPPEIGVDPEEIHTSVEWGETHEESITISNAGLGELDYSILVKLVGLVDTSSVSPLQSGGPDEYGYFWMDSDEPGVPLPEWFDISEIGTQITLGGDAGQLVDLPFEFPFYGELKDSIQIASNGYLTFGATGSSWSNHPVPDTREPNDLIAIFWDDLEPQLGNGKVFHYGDEERFVVQYQDVQRYSSGGPFTFQATLTPAGTITYHYQTMLGTRLSEATIGIENAGGQIGLQVAFDEQYVHNDLAVYFVPGWVTLDKVFGTIEPGGFDVLTATFAAHNLPQGMYKATVEIHSNDPENPQVDLDTFMFAESLIPPVIRTLTADPWAGSAPLTVQFSAVVEDVDGEIVEITWDFGDESPQQAGILNPVHIYEAEGEYTATLTILDDDGHVTEDSIIIVVQDLPKAKVEPAELWRVMRAHRSATETLTVTNVGEAALTLVAEATSLVLETGYGAGGPDDFGYIWLDSDEPGGPSFDWVEISEIGAKLTISGDDSVVVDLPFDFPFYGDLKTSIRICSDGYLTFGTKGGVWNNQTIPNPTEPNDLLAVYWDDLNPPNAPAGGGVFYHYDEVNDRFVVEWKNVPRYSNNGSYTFQALLYPDGTIVYQYLEMNFTSTYGSRGTIGIENPTGSDGLGILYNKAGYIRDGLAIEISPYKWLDVTPIEATLEPGESMDLDVTINLGLITSGIMEGSIVLETNDIRVPRNIVPVRVEVLSNNAPIITASGVNPQIGSVTTAFQFVGAAADPDGYIADKWWDFGDGSELVHEFVATHTYSREGEFTAVFTAVDNDGYAVSEAVEVIVREAASANWMPKSFSFTLGTGQEESDILMLTNEGPGTLFFGASDLADRVGMPERLAAPDDLKDPYAKTALGLYEPNLDSTKSKWLPAEVGNVLASWTCPSPILEPWGVGVLFDTHEIVIADGYYDPTFDYVVTSSGAYTGRSWSADFSGSWAADMTFDGTYIWQVNVGGDNAIHKIDPRNGQKVGSISGSPWANVSQRGLAYNANDDTFFIGGWNEDIIYKIKGESWDNPGQVIEQWSMPVAIAGLTYHPVANVLIVTNNGSPDMIYFVDVTSHATIAQLPHPAGGSNMGVGCHLAADGNLWVGSYGENRMYLIETGLGPVSAKWLTWEPGEGSVPAGGSAPITVTVNTQELSAGVHTGKVVLTTNDLDNPLIMVPVAVNVAAPPVITAASAEPVFGEPPLEVHFHAAFEAPEIPVVSYGWDFGDGTSSTEPTLSKTYTDPGTYTAVFSVVDEMGARADFSVEIEVKWLPRATVEPQTIEVTLPPLGSTVETVTLGNVEGNAELEFAVAVQQGTAPIVAMPRRIGTITDPLATTTRGLYEPIDAELAERIAASVKPGAVGDVLASWLVPSQLDTAWGVGYDTSSVWISDPVLLNDHLVTAGGVHTGTTFSTPWVGAWPGDMAYDANRNLMWQVNVGGDNGIYGLDPQTGAVVMSITTGPWAAVSQRGLAYDADTDTFYIGGWNEDVIYHFYGPSHSSPGALIAGYTFTVGIAGMAWHPDGMLWVANNGSPDMIFGLDLDALEVVYQVPHPYGGEYSGAGLTLHSDGNLWASSMENHYMYLVNTEMPLASGITVDPAKGTIAAGEIQELEITINAAELGEPGDVIKQYLEIKTNDAENPYLYVDLIVNIEGGPTIVELSATPEIGEPPLTVDFAAEVEPGATDIVDFWWDFGDGSEPVHELTCQHVYPELGDYKVVFHVVDENELEVSAELTVAVKWLPLLEVAPEAFDEVIQVGEEKQVILTVSNTGVAAMEFEISIVPTGEILRVNPAQGYLVPGGSQDVVVTLGSKDANYGTYSLHLYVTADDPLHPAVEVPVTLMINAAPVVEITAPQGGDELHGLTEIAWTTVDPDHAAEDLSIDLAWTRDGEDWHTIATALANTGSIEWNSIDVGEAGENFRIRARATDPTGAFHEFVTEEFTILNNAPEVEFSFTPSPTTRRDVVKFADESSDDGWIVTWYWDFGDEVTSSEQNPQHQYTEMDEFEISLTVTDNGGLTSTATKNITIENAIPIAAFSFEPEEPKVGEIVTFTNESTDDTEITSYFWDFGDGATSAQWSPEHRFTQAGTFKVKLTVIDEDDAVSYVEHEITVTKQANLAPVAEFSFAPSPATRRDVVKFVDASTDDGEIVAWHWEFGDGEESTTQHPEHQYSEVGEFEVTLTVTDDGELTSKIAKMIEIINLSPEVEIIKPQAGEVLVGRAEVEWRAVDPDDDDVNLEIGLEYKAAASDEWKVIASGIENSGTFNWDTSKLSGGRYMLKITATDPEGAFGDATSEEFVVAALAQTIAAAPNPTSDAVTFYYDLPTDGTLYIYSIAGRLVYSAQLSAADHRHEWNLHSGGKPVANGVYLYFTVAGGDRSEVDQLVVSR